MAKLTPEQEARYALTWNLPRSDLSMPGQLEYDRLKADYDRGEAAGGSPARRVIPSDLRVLTGFYGTLPAGGVDWLGEDLLLLALDAGRGRLGRVFVMSYALMGAELVQLAASGRIDIEDDQIVVRSLAPTGDGELDAALARIGELASPPRPGEWVARPAPQITRRYLERLRGAGVICEETRFRLTWWSLMAGFGLTLRISDAARLAEARERLDLIACSAGAVDLSQTAYAALACALGLDRLLYCGRGRRAERDRLREIAAGRWISASDAATLAAVRAAAHAVAHAAAAANATMAATMPSSC